MIRDFSRGLALRFIRKLRKEVKRLKGREKELEKRERELVSRLVRMEQRSILCGQTIRKLQEELFLVRNRRK